MREIEYRLNTPISHRKDYGQFFTPASVARLMVKWVIKDEPLSILDPGFGLGIFYDEIKQINSHKQFQFTGYEIDKLIFSYLSFKQDNKNIKVINQDYLESDLNSYDAIIANPPYLRFQKFLARHEVLPKIEQQIGKNLVGYSNIASVFLVKSLQQLNVDGRLAFIMPFEFFNTGYGKEIKKSLLDNGLLKQIVVFSNEKEIFPEATTTVCVLLCKNDRRTESIKITQIQANEEIESISDFSNFYQFKIDPSDLPYQKKWTPIIMSLFSGRSLPVGWATFSLYGSFKRGIATGANDFFALSKSTIEEFKLEEKNYCKCITKSKQIRKAIFTEDDFETLALADKAVYCLDVKDGDDLGVINYIQRGEKLGYHQRHLTKNRSPWYKIESRKPAPILFGVFNRGRLKAIRNLTNAINFTCFHLFYPNIFGEMVIDKLFVYLLSDTGQEIIKTNKRSYGNNLDKFEPGDLNESLCPNQSQLGVVSDREASEVINLAKTDEELAIKISNDLIDRIVRL
ncbi:MAG: N-6 DNA methylase [Cyanobacteriota bacterium]|nr:N-6 DNA methylase [Cyanobacteriota bacterium]